MNCKQGDLAMMIGMVIMPELNGHIVRCVRYEATKDGAPAWIVDPPLFPGIKSFDPQGLVRYVGDWVKDECLRPLDNPPDDAVDEISTRKNKKNKDALLLLQYNLTTVGSDAKV